MKYLFTTSALLIAFMSGEAAAVCAGTQVTGTTLRALVRGNTICQRPTPTSDWQWQEYHQITGSALIDYKKGASDPVDPTTTLGTWSVDTINHKVTYNYTGGSSYVFTVFDQGGGVYNFCDSTGTTVIVSGATQKTGGPVACP